MLSVSPQKSAGSGSSYFEADSYYAHDDTRSQWYGNGAKELGLSGVVTKDEFGMVLEGFSPEGTALVSNAGKPDIVVPGKRNSNGAIIEKGSKEIGRRSYIDLTFSAPKSVSLLKHADPRIEGAHNRAVERAIMEVELNFGHTRKKVEEEIRTVKTDNLVMARFNHYESRELDPQLHSHIVLMNLTKGTDGKWRSIETGDIYKNQLYIGQTYRNELAKEMKQLGYEIEVTDRKNGLYEIRGVDRGIIDEFSTRRKQVEASKKKYERYQVSEAKKMEYACLDSRRDKDDPEVGDLRKSVEERLEGYAPAFEALKEKALEQREPAKGNGITTEECIEMAIEEVTDKQSGFRKEEVLAHSMKAGLGQHGAEELKAAFEARRDLYVLGTKTQYAGRTQASEAIFYSTEGIRKTEMGVVEWAKEGRATSGIAVSDEKVKAHLEKIAHQEKPITLSKGQQEALEMICTTKDRLSIVQGDAGAGKSFACEQVKAVMEGAGYTVRGFAPTGKASVELSKAGIETKTVDSFLESAALGKTGIGQKELWIVDEAGMMGSRKTEQFLKEAEKHEAKVVLIGDTKQFQSVNQGKIFSDLQEHAGVAKAEILEVKRQQTIHAREIVTALKERDFDRAFAKIEEHGGMKEIEGREERLSAIADEYMADRRKGTDVMVLSSTNRDKVELNGEIRSRLVKAGEIEVGKTYETHQKADLDEVTRKFSDAYREGQSVVFTKDTAHINRGTEGTIVKADHENNRIEVKYWDKKSKEFKTEALNCKKYGSTYETYDTVEKKFGAGDRVIFQKNDKNREVKNGEIGTIKEIDKNGNATVGIGDERNPREYRQVEINLHGNGKTGYTYCDHAYSITSHKSQGATVDKVIINSEASSHKSSFNEFYVQATRERRDISLYTNDKELLKKQIEVEQAKVSTLDSFKDGPRYDFSRHEKAMAENRRELEKDTSPVFSAADIQKVIKEKYSFSLAPKTVTALEKGILENKIKPEIALKNIAETIEASKAKGYSWERSTLPDTHSIYAKDKNSLKEGDIIIKISPESTAQEPQYEAYRMIDSSNSKFLGSESEINFLKMRVEHYSTAIEVHNKITDAIELSAPHIKEPPSKSRGMDL